jgi:hypothetical protein
MRWVKTHLFLCYNILGDLNGIKNNKTRKLNYV